MNFEKDPDFPGLWSIALTPYDDDRGFLARTYCEREFGDHGLNTVWPQHTLTLTRRRGMLRGLHFQANPAPEIKLVRCLTGEISDAVVDLRPGSPTFGRAKCFVLSAANGRALYIPAGFAHGFQCLTDDVRLLYLMSSDYDRALSRGIRWNDPGIAIRWPIAGPALSDRDVDLPYLDQLDPLDLPPFLG